MGRYLFRRKTLNLIAAAFCLAVLSQRVSAETPDSGSGAGASVFKAAGDRRSASRRFPRGPDRPGAEIPGPPAPRQFHGGPDVFSPAFAMNERARYFLDKIVRSETETGWILSALRRSKPYAHFIRQQIENYGLPPEIFFLPVVESLYKINAHSRSGALGLWQFMRNSISPWMRIDDWVDERKDFWKSTVAAMEKLAYNYKVTGDWLLALAAYNCGLGRIQRIIRQSGLTDFWELSRRGLVPPETRAYVPKLIAVAHFAANLGRRGVEQEWEAPVRWERLPVSQAVDLRLLAEAAGLSAGSLSLGNEELIYGITPPVNKAHYLKVTAEHAEKVRTALARSGEKLLKFAVHTIAAGHTLSEIARHYGIPLSMLTRYNPGVRPETLRIGSRLVVPMYKDAGPYVKAASQSPAAAPADPALFKNEYTVKNGDSLWAIARSFGTTSAALAQVNRLQENAVIRPGQTLKVP
jgi:membrane-bound lytic murein transglycosylase D